MIIISDDKVETVMTPLIPLHVRRARFKVSELQMPDVPICIFAALVTLATAVTAVPVRAAEPAVQAGLAGCAVWTDRCVTCSRTAGGAVCSNIGIACQPEAVACVRSEEEAKKQGEKAEKQQGKQENKQ
jgi:hypothetical protein